MPSEWREVRLRDLCDDDVGIQTGPFGSQLHSSDYVARGTPIITVEHLGENRIIHSDLPRVSETDRKRLSRFALREGDIVFSRVGSVDRRALVHAEENGWLFSGRCLRVRPNPTAADAVWLSYYFGLPTFTEYIRSIAVGATMPSLNTRLLGDVHIQAPPLAVQRSIARILGALDDKIELNRKMNETLEQMAQAIFKSWFVDFEPFRDKGMVDSPQGKIPKGWEVKPLPEAIEMNPPRSLCKGCIAPYLDMQNMPERGHRPAGWIQREFGSGTRFTNGDTLVARITPCLENGKTAFVDFLGDGQVGWGSTEFLVLRPKPPLPEFHAYLLARSEEFRSYAIQNMTGSSGRQRVPPECLAQFDVLVPDEEAATRFGAIVAPLVRRIKVHSEQSRTLAAIRDALLPKLMSGEVTVSSPN